MTDRAQATTNHLHAQTFLGLTEYLPFHSALLDRLATASSCQRRTRWRSCVLVALSPAVVQIVNHRISTPERELGGGKGGRIAQVFDTDEARGRAAANE